MNDGDVIDMQDLHSMVNDHGLLTFKYTNVKMLSSGNPYVMHIEFVVVDKDVKYLKNVDCEENKHE